LLLLPDCQRTAPARAPRGGRRAGGRLSLSPRGDRRGQPWA